MQSTDHTFTTFDGTAIAYRAWLPPGRPTRAVLLLHRGHEHGGRWGRFVDDLTAAGDDGVADGLAVFAWDQRGHGRSGGERGRAPDFGAVVRDLDLWARHTATTFGVDVRDTVVVAASVGAVVAVAWVHDYGPPVRGLVVAAGAFAVKLYVPLALATLRAKEAVRPGGHVQSFVRPSMLTGVPAEQAAYAADPLIFRQIAVNLLVGLADAGRRLVADAGAITTPTLVLVAGRDWVVKRRPQVEFYRRLGATAKRLAFYRDGRHALFHDTVAPAATAAVRQFVAERFAAGRLPPAGTTAASLVEHDLLHTPRRSLGWRAVRAAIAVGGLFSDGLRLGRRTGFDSGRTLDYVYANQSAGRTVVGRLVDRAYLNAIGWRGIRVRRQHLAELLRQAVGTGPAHVLDVAAGAGRYVLELARDVPGVTAELRDYRSDNLDAARARALELGVADRVTFTVADAFDPAAVAAASPRPTVAVVSGLYELVADNGRVARSLAGVAAAVPVGGTLIYTGQPWHPQVEFIARALGDHRGEPWVMRRRSVAELDELVRSAGFEKVDQRIDRWGIFTVAVARRVGDVQ